MFRIEPVSRWLTALFFVASGSAFHFYFFRFIVNQTSALSSGSKLPQDPFVRAGIVILGGVLTWIGTLYLTSLHSIGIPRRVILRRGAAIGVLVTWAAIISAHVFIAFRQSVVESPWLAPLLFPYILLFVSMGVALYGAPILVISIPLCAGHGLLTAGLLLALLELARKTSTGLARPDG